MLSNCLLLKLPVKVCYPQYFLPQLLLTLWLINHNESFESPSVYTSLLFLAVICHCNNFTGQMIYHQVRGNTSCLSQMCTILLRGNSSISISSFLFFLKNLHQIHIFTPLNSLKLGEWMENLMQSSSTCTDYLFLPVLITPYKLKYLPMTYQRTVCNFYILIHLVLC